MPAKIMRNIMYIRCCNAGSMLVSTQINTISINKVLQCRQKICTLRLRTIWKSDTLTYVIKRLMCYNHTDPIVFWWCLLILFTTVKPIELIIIFHFQIKNIPQVLTIYTSNLFFTVCHIRIQNQYIQIIQIIKRCKFIMTPNFSYKILKWFKRHRLCLLRVKPTLIMISTTYYDMLLLNIQILDKLVHDFISNVKSLLSNLS